MWRGAQRRAVLSRRQVAAMDVKALAFTAELWEREITPALVGIASAKS